MPPPKATAMASSRSKPSVQVKNNPPARSQASVSASDTNSSEITTSEDDSSDDSPPMTRRMPSKTSMPRKSPPKLSIKSDADYRPSLTRNHTAPPLQGTSRASITSVQTFDSADTQSSIRDDPFFRIYQSPQSVRFAKDIAKTSTTRSAPAANTIDAQLAQGRRGSETTIRAQEEAHRSRKPSIVDSLQEYFPDGDPHTEMREINIVVVGAQGVGKTTFIQKAHDLRLPPKSAQCARNLMIDGVVHTIRMIEMLFTESLIDDERKLVWPRRVDGELLPPVDGVLSLYDVLNEESITHIPDLLEALVKASLPTLLVSCKCDIPMASRQIDPNVIEQVGTMFGGVQAFQTSANVPETQKKCLGSMIRMIVNRRRENPRAATTRRRSNSTINNGRPPSPTSYGHGRRSSETSGMVPKQPNPMAGYRLAPAVSADPRTGQSGSATESTSQNPTEFASSGNPALSVVSELPFRANESRDLDDDIGPTDKPHTFLNVGEDKDEKTLMEGIEVHSISEYSLAEMPVKNPGSSWDELLDRLVAQPLSKADTNFVTIFLTLYRKFAAPGDLLDGILSRFSKINSDDNPHLIRMTSQLRYLGVLTNWLGQFPGDFGHMRTRNRLKLFTEHISTNRVFAVAAKEMRACLEIIVEDDDNVWGKTDNEKYRMSASASQLTGASSVSTIVRRPSEIQAEMSDSLSQLASEQYQKRISDAPSNTSSMPGHSRSSSQTLLNHHDAFERYGPNLPLAMRITLQKEIYKSFMEIPDEDIASELTRMDWQMFSTFRPRDLIRHISMSAVQREKCRSLEQVDQMIRQFNFTAYWVGNMILLRDKPKHRVLVLEKFMRVARKLRGMNNYNSLGAVIAGIKGNAVHRLLYTRELVSADISKDFMKWEILMGTQKSHFAYRLAWDNSTAERIPFLPLHRRDLVSAEEGNRTFIGKDDEKINWKKFEIMGDVILGIQRSLSMPYQDLKRNVEVERLILENSSSGDDDELMAHFQELYERSVQLEPKDMMPLDPSGPARKKFNWFKSQT